MWWPEGRRRAARARPPAITLVLVAGAGLGLAGCTGFRPLYADPSVVAAVAGAGSGTDYRETLSRIEIGPIAERTGVKLRNDLIFELTGTGNEAANPLYRLDISLSSVRVPLAILPGTGRPQSYHLIMTAAYRLAAVGSGTGVTAGSLTARIPFDATVQRFATIRAEREAEDRGAKELAVGIRTAIAGALARAAGRP